MGLDMYLYEVPEDLYDKDGNLNTDPDFKEPLMYWRKANHIHAWFLHCKALVPGVLYLVTRTDLQQLIDICKAVLDKNFAAPLLLPRCRGCFFGSYEYDERYFEDIQDTVNALQKILKDNDDETFVYYASW